MVMGSGRQASTSGGKIHPRSTFLHQVAMRRQRANRLIRFMLAASVLASGILSPFADEVDDPSDPAGGATAGYNRFEQATPHLPGHGPAFVAGRDRLIRRGFRPGIPLAGWMTRTAAHHSAGDDEAERADPCVPIAIVDWTFSPEGLKESGFNPWDLTSTPAIIPDPGHLGGRSAYACLASSPNEKTTRSPLLRC